MAKSVGVHEAKTQLSRLLAAAEAGEEVVITNRGRAIAKLVPVGPAVRTFGMDRGRITIADDFDAPLPDDLIDAFEG